MRKKKKRINFWLLTFDYLLLNNDIACVLFIQEQNNKKQIFICDVSFS